MNKNYNRNFKASLGRLELVILLGKGFTYPIRKEFKQQKNYPSNSYDYSRGK